MRLAFQFRRQLPLLFQRHLGQHSLNHLIHVPAKNGADPAAPAQAPRSASPKRSQAAPQARLDFVLAGNSRFRAGQSQQYVSSIGQPVTK